jgi:hypothetical protein
MEAIINISVVCLTLLVIFFIEKVLFIKKITDKQKNKERQNIKTFICVFYGIFLFIISVFLYSFDIIARANWNFISVFVLALIIYALIRSLKK